ncbi:MAG: hypothetical protein ACRECD_06140 [Burkholderiaceae bacterium]
MALRTLLYRYFFFGWLFRDVNRGNQFERSVAWRHNQAQAHWLPTYMRRWLVCGLLLYVGGAFVERVLGAPIVSLFLYMPGALSLPIDAVIVVAWAGLKALSGPP